MELSYAGESVSTYCPSFADLCAVMLPYGSKYEKQLRCGPKYTNTGYFGLFGASASGI